jgi:hypothetical protein
VERRSRSARATAPASTSDERPTWSIALWVSDPPILWTDVTHASAPWASALAGTSGWKPKCGPHDWSTTSGTPAAWAAGRAARHVGAHAVVRRRDDERRARVGAPASAMLSADGVTPWAIPSSGSYSGATKLGIPPDRTRPSTSEACELRWATTRAPSGASASASAWLPWVAPFVRKNVRAAP